MNSNKSPAMNKVHAILENVRDNVHPSKRQRWQRILDLLEQGVDQYETIIAEIEAENHRLKSDNYHGLGEDWETLLYGDDTDHEEEEDSDEKDD